MFDLFLRAVKPSIDQHPEFNQALPLNVRSSSLPTSISRLWPEASDFLGAILPPSPDAPLPASRPRTQVNGKARITASRTFLASFRAVVASSLLGSGRSPG